MTEQAWTPVEQQQAPKRPWTARLIEFGIWFVAPFGVMIVGIILALIFGAPTQRVIGVFAFVAFAAGAYFMYRPSDRFKVRRARAAGLLYTALVASIGALPTPPPSATPAPSAQRVQSAPAPTLTPEQQAARRAQQQEQEAARQQAEQAAAATSAENARTEYVARLDRELSGVSAQSLLENTNTPDNIIITVAMFSALADIYDDGASLNLSPEQERARQRFKSRVIALQTQVFPQLRNRYGTAASRAAWENDMEIRTLGTGYRTIDLIWAGFAANRNIADFHSQTRENFEALRFKRARYMWYRDADRWQYYTLETPNDGDLAVLRGGTWVVLH